MRTNLTLAENERIVVTGMGAVTPLGLDVESSWTALCDGEIGVAALNEAELSNFPGYEELGVKVFGAVKDSSMPDEFKERGIKVDQGYMHRSALLGARAVHEALSQAQLLDERLVIDDTKGVDPYEVGLFMGSTFAGMGYAAEAAAKERLRPSDLFKSLPARVSTSLAMQYGINGPSPMVGWECASGAITLDLGARSLKAYQDGTPALARIMVAGGADGPVEPSILRYFDAIDAVSPSDDPRTASRPFDKGANGLVMAEGAGALVLETLGNAIARGLSKEQIIAELVGYASFTHADTKTRAGIEGAIKAMRKAGRLGRVALGKTIYINAHATSTEDGDPIEARIIQEFAHHEGLNKKDIWMNSSKGATGHTMGASGAIESIFAVKALVAGVVPPAANLDNPIDGVGGFNMSPHQATKLEKIDLALSNSLGFGGGVTTLAFRKFEP